jgi:hypothetical protein
MLFYSQTGAIYATAKENRNKASETGSLFKHGNALKYHEVVERIRVFYLTPSSVVLDSKVARNHLLYITSTFMNNLSQPTAPTLSYTKEQDILDRAISETLIRLRT